MSEKMEAVATSEAPAALGAYSQAVKANGFVFVSGQLGIDPATGELAGETAGEQAAQALKNIKHILDTAGTGIEHVCRATIYLKNVEDFKEVDARYAEVFIGSVKPARVAFGNNMIPKGALVEIDAFGVACFDRFPGGPSARRVCAEGPPRIVRRIPGNVALESLGGGPCHNRDHGIQRKTVAAFGRKPAE